jgi:AcrR family transcriptional regulator
MSKENSTTKGATGARRLTEKLVENAALELIEEEGVLAGLNLQEVANRADVNRALVYHYFSTKRELLRTAIKHRMASGADKEHTPADIMDLGERVAAGLERGLQYEHILRLTTLLHLDGSTAPKLMPNANTTLLLLDRDRLSGKISDEADLEALHAMYAALTFGYVLFHEVFARDLAIDPAELDARVAAEVRRLFGSVDTTKKSEDTPSAKEPDHE